jgi:AcrR family transcriptional regulator
VVQVKKKFVEQAILDSAFELFSERGYHATTLQDIAARARIGVGTVYSYVPSKIHLLYAVVEPWQKDGFERLEKRVGKIKPPRERLRAILLGIWRDIPMENIGLANSLMEALASADPSEGKPSPLLAWVESKLMAMLRPVLQAAGQRRLDYDMLPNLLMMAYDGFVINRRLNDLRDIERQCNAMCDLILGPEAERS